MNWEFSKNKHYSAEHLHKTDKLSHDANQVNQPEKLPEKPVTGQLRRTCKGEYPKAE
jgi:hypothetical protein